MPRAMLVLLLVCGAGLGTTASRMNADVPVVDATPGSVVRWSVPGTVSCGMGDRSWKALKETCYYPIDLLHKPATVRVSRRGARSTDVARIRVVAVDSPREHITLGDIPQAHPSASDLQRNASEQARVAKLWKRPEGPARFALPLAPPATPLPAGTGFGSTWIFNTTPESSELHSGEDYALSAGTIVRAAADGTIVLAGELFLSGNSVFIDHGDGLVTMYFHLDAVEIRPGERVERGAVLGSVGATGRVTGPHLHLGARWHGARVDPRLLLDDPAKMPAIDSGRTLPRGPVH